MKGSWIIRCLLAALVVAGLLLAPMPSAQAQSMSAAMAAGMPCCPDDAGHDKCKDCAQMVLCSLKILHAIPLMSVAVIENREPVARELVLASAFAIDELATPPPARPPRS